jgi:hypothetical protein
MCFHESSTFQRNVSPPSSGSNSKLSKKPTESGAPSKMCKVNVAVKWLAFLFRIEKSRDRMTSWKLEILKEDLCDSSQSLQ